MEWFTQEVIPILRGHNLVLDVHLIGSMTPELKERFEAEGYTVRGFVDNLAAEYTLAQVAIVPLWLGAGVKFKTVEAALHGVPLVSTSVGAEGIPALSGQPQVSDDAGEFAAAIIEAMRLPDVAQRGADLLRDRILDQHGPDAVNSALDAVLAGLRQPTKR